MAFGQKIISSLKDAFSYAVHRESAADHARKPAVVEALMAASLPLVDDSPEYTARLYKVLSKTSTQALDMLKAKQVAVMLDARLEEASERKAKVEGVYYPAPQATAAGGIVTLYDPPAGGFWNEPAWHGPVMLNELHKQFGGKELPQSPLYANVNIDVTIGEMATILQTTRVEWGTTVTAAQPKVGAPPLKAPKP